MSLMAVAIDCLTNALMSMATVLASAFLVARLDILAVRHYNSDMAFVRTKRIKNKTYYYLVESKREGNKIRQRVIKYLGAEMPTKEQVAAMTGGSNENRTLR